MAAESNLSPASQFNSENFWLSLGMYFPEHQHVNTPAVHTHDGQGRRIEGGPISTSDACRAGIALFE